MAFDYTTLITDRTAADVARVQTLAAKNYAAMTDAEKAEWTADMKGAYNAGDMNRVSACMEDLAARFRALGYHVPGYERVEVQRNASRLPEGYTEVEYIESSGTQYVETGFTPNQDTRVVCTMQCTDVDGTYGFFGTRYSGSAQMYDFVNISTPRFYSDYNANAGGYVTSTTEWVTIDKNKNITALNGETFSTITYAAFQCVAPMSIFAVNANGSISFLGKMKLSSFLVYDNGTLVRDYIPCIDPSGEIGLYDLVEESFYANAGTGTFTAGDAVATASESDEELDPYTWYETDAPTENQMEQYRGNVAAVRRVVAQAASTPTTPETMAGLTVDTANDIETILADTDRLVTNISKAWYYSGEVYAGEI